MSRGRGSGVVRARGVAVGLRAAAAALLVAAVAAQLVSSLGYWHRIGIRDVPLRVGHFFSAFTNLTALAGVLVLAVGAVLLLRRRGPLPVAFEVVRLCFLVAIVLTGVVYNVLLRGAPVAPGLQVDWANETLHVVAPLVAIADWVLAPGRARLPLAAAAIGIVPPILWLGYSLVRGPLVSDEIARTPYWYPYGFLDPVANGWVPVLALSALLVGMLVVLGVLAVAVHRLEDRALLRRASGTAGPSPAPDVSGG